MMASGNDVKQNNWARRTKVQYGQLTRDLNRNQKSIMKQTVYRVIFTDLAKNLRNVNGTVK